MLHCVGKEISYYHDDDKHGGVMYKYCNGRMSDEFNDIIIIVHLKEILRRAIGINNPYVADHQVKCLAYCFRDIPHFVTSPPCDHRLCKKENSDGYQGVISQICHCKA